MSMKMRASRFFPKGAAFPLPSLAAAGSGASPAVSGEIAATEEKVVRLPSPRVFPKEEGDRRIREEGRPA